MDEIEDYLLEDAPYYAEDVISGIIASTWRLERFPESRRLMDDDQLEDMPESGLRKIIHGNYRIAYDIDEETQIVEIQAVKHTSQNF